MSYSDFVSADCATKVQMASNSGLTFAYVQPFICPKFKQVGENSAENLVLYQYISK